ncbi:MAG: hypothetical protein IJX51_06780 [Clostridia bacterium]|nr:hypothetical protein [Clostridia bacterium]
MRLEAYKNPSMPFYPLEFLAQIAFLNGEQVKGYMKILCYMYLNGRLKREEMITACGKYDEDVFSLFTEDEKGLFYNEKMEFEIMKREQLKAKKPSSTKGKGSKSKRKSAVHKENQEEPQEEKRTYTENGNVLLTDKEYNKLKDTVGEELDELIERLSLYMLSQDKNYKSHYATLMTWYRRDHPSPTKSYGKLESMCNEDISYLKNNL